MPRSVTFLIARTIKVKLIIAIIEYNTHDIFIDKYQTIIFIILSILKEII